MDREFNVDIIASIQADMSKLEAKIKALENNPIDLKVDADIKDVISKLKSGLDKGLKIDFSSISKGLSNSIAEGIKAGGKSADNILKESIGNVTKNGKTEDLLFGDAFKSVHDNVKQAAAQFRSVLKIDEINGKKTNSLKVAGIEESINQLKELKSLMSEMNSNMPVNSITRQFQLDGLTSELSTVQDKIKTVRSELQNLYAVKGAKSYGSAQEIEDLINNRTDGKLSEEFKAVRSAFNNYGDNNSSFLNAGQIKTLEMGRNILAQYLAMGGDLQKLKINNIDPDSKMIKGIDGVGGIENDIAPLKERLASYSAEEKALQSKVDLTQKQLELSKQQESSVGNVAKATQEAAKVEERSSATAERTAERRAKVSKNKMTADEFLGVKQTAEEKTKSFLSNQGYTHNGISISHDELGTGLVKISSDVKNAEGEWQRFGATVTKTGDLVKQSYKAISAPKQSDLISKEEEAKSDATKEKYSQIMQSMKEVNDLQGKLTKARDNDKDTGNYSKEIETYVSQLEAADAKLKSLDANSFMNSDDAKTHLNTKQLDAYNESLSKRAQLEAQASDAEQRRDLDTQKSDYSNQIKELESSLKNSGTFSDGIKQQIDGLKESVNSLTTSSLKSFGDQFQQEISSIEKSASSLQTKLESDIQSKLNDDTYTAKLAQMRSDLNKYDGQDSAWLEKATQHANNYEQAISNLSRHFDAGDAFKLDEGGLKSNFESLSTSADGYANSLKAIKAEMSETLDPGKAAAGAAKVSNFMENNTKATKKYGDELERVKNLYKNATTKADEANANSEYNKVTSLIKSEGLTGNSFMGEIGRIGKQVAGFVGVYQVFQKGIDVVKKMGAAVQEVDASMTNLKMATGVNNAEAKQLMSTYSEMGKTLKATGTDVATSATEWLKQGKSLQESESLATDSIILSKIGDLSSEQSTSYLTSAMKGYKVEAENALSIVDKLSTVDMASATDVGGLAEGMSRVANNANLAGVSMDKLLGYLATVGEVTQRDMASVGTSFNSIFSRMSNIKLARLKDYQNSGEDLSDVETVLKGEGINLRDDQQTFRDFGDVLDETASKWNGFSEVSQRALAKAFAGTNHMEDFLVLMENYGQALDYTGQSANSSGSSLEKFSAYQESFAGKMEGFKNQFQQFSTTALSGDFMKGLVEGGTGALSVITQLVDKVGILGTVGGAIGLFQGAKGRGEIHFAV